MKKLLIALAALSLTLLSNIGQAEYSESVYSKYEHSAWASMGFTEGGFSLGGDYEYAADRTFGVGGLTRFYQQDDDRGGAAPGIFMFGGFVRPHFHRRAWDLYVTAGAAIISIENDATDEKATSLGPIFGVGLLYQMKENIAIGIESMGSYIWFDSDFRGQVMEDAMLRLRFSL